MRIVIDNILKRTGMTRYRLAQSMGVSTQALDHMFKTNSQAVRIRVLIRLQEVSGFSVTQFWQMLKDEHVGLDDDGVD
jgi:plasmid maintenance system antidote protein VapI